MPELSVGASLAWKYAARITLGKKQEQIDKEHLLIGICYLDKAVHHEKELQNLHLSTSARNDFLAEHHQLAGIFKQAGFLAMDLRHCLWDILPEGSYQHDGTVVHRSESCKKVFVEAESVARMQGSPVISSVHLIAAICKDPGERIKRTLTDLKTTCRDVYHMALDSETLSKPSVVISDDFSDIFSSSQTRTAPSKAPRKTEWLTLLFGRDLTSEAQEGTLAPCIGRRKEMLQTIQTLARSTKNNPLLIGKPGVGKTALVHALANRIACGKDSHVLKGKRIVQLDIGVLIHQASQKKSVEKLFSRIIEETRSHPEWIIFIDQIHHYVGTSPVRGNVSLVANLIKPAIERGDLQCIGATTVSEYKRCIEPDSSIKRRFATIIVNEPTRKETLEILECLKENWESHHGVTISGQALEAAVDLSVRFDKKHRLPDKAIDLIDKACSRTRIPSLSMVFEGDLNDREAASIAAAPDVTEEMVVRVLSESTGVPYATILKNRSVRASLDQRMAILIRDAIKRYSHVSPESISTHDLFHAYPSLLGRSKKIKKVCDRIQKVAPTDEPVLIVGETGTGKELVAGAIHQISRRAKKSMIILNSAAIPEELIESELFGHEKGAFTGAAAAKRGKFELADNGTLFLDEIGDMSLKTQAKILRIIQEQTFERVGGDKTRSVNVRLLAATHRNLKELITKEQFREDLFYRLNVYAIVIPPLRERPTDIPLLAVYFILEKHAKGAGVTVKLLAPEAIALLMHYPWPGNVRQLRNVIGSVLVDMSGESRDTITRRDIEKALKPLEKYYSADSPVGESVTGAFGNPAVDYNLPSAKSCPTGQKTVPPVRSSEGVALKSAGITIKDEVNRWMTRFEVGEKLEDHKAIFRTYGQEAGMKIYIALFEEGKERYGTFKDFIQHIGLLDQHAAIRNKLLLFRRKLENTSDEV